MDIEEHLTQHEDALRALAFKYGRKNQDLLDDCNQAGALVLIEAHAGSFRHESQLLTYVYEKVNEVMLEQVKLIKTEYRYGIIEELDELQEIAEEQGRDRLRLDRLYDEPIAGLRRSPEQAINVEQEELARKVWVALRDEDKHILETSYGRSTRRAAEALGLTQSGYRKQLKRAVERARELAGLWELWRD